MGQLSMDSSSMVETLPVQPQPVEPQAMDPDSEKETHDVWSKRSQDERKATDDIADKFLLDTAVRTETAMKSMTENELGHILISFGVDKLSAEN
jgi:hypothetical protein